jgi:hypothetical protein
MKICSAVLQILHKDRHVVNRHGEAERFTSGNFRCEHAKGTSGLRLLGEGIVAYIPFARQQRRKYATVLGPLLCSGPRTTMEEMLEAVFSMWSAPRLYHSTDRVELLECNGVERVGW